MPQKIRADFPYRAALPLLVLLAMAVPPLFPAGSAAETYGYQEKTGTRTSFFQWQLAVDQAQLATITAREEKALYVNVCDNSGATHEWRMQKEDAEVTARRLGNELHIHGRQAGETIDERITLDDSPWFQPLSYSLRRSLVTGRGREQTFWMIRPDKLRPQKFQAVREGEENISTPAGCFRAVRVRISPAGLLACVWRGYYWFRLEDGLFLRYEGAHGPPGTPKTTISLAPPGTSGN